MTCQRLLTLFGLLLPLAGACDGASSTVAGNKNTNWLVSCTSSAECGDAATCTCGVCTIPCASSDACAESSGTCTELLATTVQCGGTSESPVCLKACESEGDCDGSQICLQSTCVTRPQDLCGATADAALCRGLDAAIPDGWNDASAPGEEVKASTKLRFSGAESLLAQTTGANGRSRLIHELPMMTSGSLYLRAWAYMNAGAVVNDVHGFVVGDANTADYGTKFLYSAGKLRVATPRADVGSSVPVPFGRWYCLRLELDIGNAGSVKAYVDDDLLADETGVDTLPATGVHNVSVGIDFAGQTEPGELYFDDVVVDRQPIDCWR